MFRVLIAAAVLAATAAIGAAPAAGANAPYPNCTAAKADGRCDIAESDPAYGTWLDRDGDGIGCEC